MLGVVNDDDLTDGGASLADLGEGGLLRGVFATVAGGPQGLVDVGPGDDTALLRVGSGRVLATTDTMVRGRDWLDEWSGAQDVGRKAVTQNLADLASMGGAGTGLLVTLVAPTDLPAAWATALTEGIAAAAHSAGVPVVGGDLSSAPDGVVMVSITALGELADGVSTPVLRSGARAGDVLAVSGPLGRSGAGWALLRRGVLTAPHGSAAHAALAHHRRPVTDLTQGPVAARAGATAMIDVSDGLGRDGDRVARASGVRVVLDPEAIRALADGLPEELPVRERWTQVLSGGEEHELLATFPAAGAVPEGWVVLGRVEAAGQDGPGVLLGEEPLDPVGGGWDHFVRG